MDKIIEQIDAMITHVFNMPKSSDTDMILAGLQDLRNMVTAQKSVQRTGGTPCPECGKLGGSHLWSCKTGELATRN